MRSPLARAAPRWLLASFLVSFLVACPGRPTAGALQVLVNLEGPLVSRCVKVTATDGTLTRETRPMLLSGRSQLRVGVTGDELAQPVTVQAVGYLDEGCMMPTAGEVSERVEANFTDPVSTVTVTLRPVARADGGADAGEDSDAGLDAGVDAGVDDDRDTFPLPADCDDTNPAVNPGATESCSNGLDDDCDLAIDCQDTACQGRPCAGGGTCNASVCVALTEVLCNDALDNDGDTRIDCADPDCPTGTACSDLDSCTQGDRCVADGGCEKATDTTCVMPPNAACYAPLGQCLPDAGTCGYTPVDGGCDDGLGCTDTDVCTVGFCGGTARACLTPGNVCLMPTGSCQEPAGTCRYAPRSAGTGACDDGQRCTVDDACDGDGGCAGVAVPCLPPSDCHAATGTCELDAGCLFSPRTGVACDGGAGRLGICGSDFSCQPSYSSCLDLLGVSPTTPTGVYVIDPDGAGAGAPLLVTCEMVSGDAGWTLISFEDFTSDAGGWSDRRRDTSSSCFTDWGAMLGGYNLFGSGASPSKTYDLLGVPHTTAHVQLDYFVIDSWDNEAARVSIDGTRVYDTSFTYGGANTCGALWGDLGRQRVSAAPAHTANSLLLNVTSTLNGGAGDESFGVDNVRVLVR